MFCEGLLEALLIQSPLRRRVNRSWYSYRMLKKGTHTMSLAISAYFAVLELGQACESTGASAENIRRGRLSSMPKSWSKVDVLSAGRPR